MINWHAFFSPLNIKLITIHWYQNTQSVQYNKLKNGIYYKIYHQILFICF